MGEEKLSYEQLEAALWLVAVQGCFASAVDHEGHWEINPKFPMCGQRLVIEENMNDTFYYSCADGETIPWDELVGVARALSSLKESDRSWWLVHFAAVKRGHDPKVERVKSGLDKWRAEHPEILGAYNFTRGPEAASPEVQP